MTELINRWTVGSARITRIVEFESGFPAGVMFAGLTEERVKSVGWIHPHYADPDGTIRYAVQAYVVESGGYKIIVDTCVGNGKERAYEGWNRLKLPFLERLIESGFPAESIDFVLCTHLHIDHVGWNTRWDGDKWVPTFPNARYLFGRLEWEHWSHENHGIGDVPQQMAALIDLDPTIADSVLPIVKFDLHNLVETDHILTDEVSLFATPGHTPGHVSVAIRSGGQEAVITGDLIHNPIQFADPGICCNFDDNQELALTTRQTFISNHADRDVLVFGTHFTTPAVGRIVSDNKTWLFEPANSND
jgi:glyoxylase-like metal-dependent hydrolase (beta-lactamase superfamily II)